MADNLPPSLTFSQEEVVLLLKLFNAPTIPGVGEDPLPGLDEERQRLILSTAERGLKARQLVSKAEDGTVVIEKMVLALLGTCVAPEFSVIASRIERRQPPENIYFHCAQKMVVAHTISGPGLHTFAALTDRAQLFDHLQRFLKLTDKPALPESGNVAATALRDALQALESGAEAIQQHLLNGGASPAFAQVLSQELNAATINYTILAMQHPADGETRTRHLSLLDTAHTLWKMEGGEETAETTVLRLKSVATATARQELADMILSS